jgi:hypothetical protein
MSMQPAQLAASTAIDRAIAALTYDHIEQIPLDGGPVLVNDQVPLLQRSIGADLIRIEAAMSAKGKTLLSAIAASIDEAVVALAEAKAATALCEAEASLKVCRGNLKPAPFFLNEKAVRDVLEGKPGKTCDLVPLSPEKLVDQPGPYCGPYPIPKAAENGSQNEPARVAPAKAEPSAPVESPNLDRPDTNVTSGTRSKPVRRSDVQYRNAKDRDARELEAPVDRLDVIRAVAANLERRERMGLPARAPRAPRFPRAPIAERRPAKAIKLPPLPVEQRRARVAAAIAFLKRQCILVDICDRDAQIRRYRVSGRRESMLAEDVIQLAIDKGLDANV